MGAFYGYYNFSDDESLIYTQSTYRSSKYIPDEKLYKVSKEDYLNILNENSKIGLWHNNENRAIKRVEFVFVLENDLKLDKTQFFNKLYSKILLLQNNWGEIEKRNFIRAFFELRGSVDLKLNFLTLDYFYNSEFEIKRIRLLSDVLDFPFYVLNFNFRELQSQFVSGENKRNTQLRVNLSWYISNIGIINPYKIEIVKTKFSYLKDGFFDCDVGEFNKRNNFENRINFYSNYIYDKDLVKFDINELRKELEFDADDSQNFRRNTNIIQIMKATTKDECAACKAKYNIKDRSFLTRQNRYYTEIHHFISLGKNKDLDILENLTKLCPVCHRALGRGSSSKEYQKELIENILCHNEQNLEFAKIIFESNDIDILSEKVQANLK